MCGSQCSNSKVLQVASPLDSPLAGTEIGSLCPGLLPKATKTSLVAGGGFVSGYPTARKTDQSNLSLESLSRMLFWRKSGLNSADGVPVPPNSGREADSDREELEAGALGKLTGNGVYSVGGSLVMGALLMVAGPRPLRLQH